MKTLHLFLFFMLSFSCSFLAMDKNEKQSYYNQDELESELIIDEDDYAEHKYEYLQNFPIVKKSKNSQNLENKIKQFFQNLQKYRLKRKKRYDNLAKKDSQNFLKLETKIHNIRHLTMNALNNLLIEDHILAQKIETFQTKITAEVT